MVDQKAGGVRRDRREMPGLLGQLNQPLDDCRIGAFTTHHFDELHQRHGIEEMKTRHPLRPRAGAGDAGDR